MQLQEDGLDVAPLGTGVDMLTLGPASTAMADSILQYVDSRVKARGEISWHVLDTANTVKLEISSTMQYITNTSANRSAIPEYLYCLSLEPQTIFVVLQWNSDLVETGLNLGSPSATDVVNTDTSMTVPFEVTSEAFSLFKKVTTKTLSKTRTPSLRVLGIGFSNRTLNRLH